MASGLRERESVEVFATSDSPPIAAKIIALDARVDPTTRNALVRARIEDTANAPAPGSSVRVRVPDAKGMADALYFDDPSGHIIEIRTYEA